VPARAAISARSWRNWNVSPIISATSARSATTRPYVLIHAHCGILRERFCRRRISASVIASCATDRARRRCARPARRWRTRLRELVMDIGPRFRELYEHYDATPSLLDRTVTTGIVAPELVRRLRPAVCRPRFGPRFRRASRSFIRALRQALLPRAAIDRGRCRRAHPHPRGRNPREPVAAEPDARRLAAGRDHHRRSRAGRAMRGRGRHRGLPRRRVRLFALAAGGTVARCHPRDPSWFQWPLLEAAIEHNIVADFPLCNKSFNCSYSGHDL
jgi:hypothetical protein